MVRVDLKLPERVRFTAELQVRVSDLNYGGHVGNDSILTLMQEARVQYYRSLGIQDEVRIDGTVGQIITDASVVFKSESFLGDVLSVNIYLGDFNKYGFDMYYQISNRHTGKEVARGKTGIVCFDYERRRIASLSPAFLEKLTSNDI